MVDNQSLARDFLNRCRSLGFGVSIRASVVSVSKAFTPGDKSAFVECDMDAPGLLAMLPAGSGTIWGTDGATIGGHAALQSGRFQLNRSGIKARFLSALSKIVGTI